MWPGPTLLSLGGCQNSTDSTHPLLKSVSGRTIAAIRPLTSACLMA